MAHRAYDTAKDGAAYVTCSKCGETSAPAKSAFGRNLPPEAFTKHLRHKGWVIANTNRKDLCPACAAPARKTAPKETDMGRDAKIVEIKPAMPGISELPPREMTREDRRIIFAQLEEVYVDENTGYMAEWNDERVGKHLNCPRKWVEMIREENFGPQHAPESPQVKALIERLDAAHKEISAYATESIDLKSKASDLVTQSLTLNAKANGLLATITAIRDDLKKLTGR